MHMLKVKTQEYCMLETTEDNSQAKVMKQQILVQVLTKITAAIRI